jgi:predicted outer membrane repeat protein
MVTINKCKFYNLSSQSNGGAIFASASQLIMNSKHTFSNNDFVGNYANKGSGGAINIESTYLSSIIGNSFTSNKAKRGGALCFSCSKFKTIDPSILPCKAILHGRNNFR